ncbi:MAG: methionyl-tRNA formyltransferase [Acidimicrobiia bacterium]
MTNTAFFGTPEAAIPSLAALAGATDLRLVVTRPPRRQGRGRALRPSPVGAWAEEAGLPIATPANRSELVALDLTDIDVAVVVAYGALIPPTLLEATRRGFLNVHFSLLPRWRGAAPVERAILAGDTEVGVTIMVMDEGLDTGPILATASLDAGRRPAGELTAELAEVGAGLLVDVLAGWVRGELEARPQPAGGTSAPKLTPDEGHLDPDRPAEELDRRVRACTPRPGAWVLTDHGRLGVLRAEAVPGDRPPGTLELVDGAVAMGTGDGALRLLEVRPEGRRSMPAEDWARGRRGGLGTAR